MYLPVHLSQHPTRPEKRTQKPHSSSNSYPKGSEPLTLTIVTPWQRSMLRCLELISVNSLRVEVALDKSSTPGILAYIWGWKHKLWSQTAWGRISALPPTSYVTLTSSLPHQHQAIKETDLYRNDFQKVGDFFLVSLFIWKMGTTIVAIFRIVLWMKWVN